MVPEQSLEALLLTKKFRRKWSVGVVFLRRKSVIFGSLGGTGNLVGWKPFLQSSSWEGCLTSGSEVSIAGTAWEGRCDRLSEGPREASQPNARSR